MEQTKRHPERLGGWGEANVIPHECPVQSAIGVGNEPNLGDRATEVDIISKAYSGERRGDCPVGE